MLSDGAGAAVLQDKPHPTRPSLKVDWIDIQHIRAIVQVQQTYAKISLMMEECDLRQLIEDALRVQMAALQRHGVAVVCELLPALRVKVDKHKVLQILINLISNAKCALDTMPEGERHLRVRLMAEGRHARIQLEDNGMGISGGAGEALLARLHHAQGYYPSDRGG